MGADNHPTTTPKNRGNETYEQEPVFDDSAESYDTTNYTQSLIAYDGELIELSDGAYRHKKDEARQRYYAWAEEQLDDLQMTFDDVKERLEQ